MIASPPVLSGLAEIAADFDVIFCDVWGVLHNGVVAFAGAIDALQRFRAKGGQVILLTNAPRPSREVRASLAKLGVAAGDYDDIVSSGDVAVSLMLERKDEPLAHLGYPRETGLFEEAAARGHAPRIVPIETAAFVVCTGLVDARRDRLEDYDARLALMKARELDFICANPDIVVQVGADLMYCAGAIAERYEAMGGRVIQAGKPHAPIYACALHIAEALSGGRLDRGRVLAIGDAMHTDIRGGQQQGLTTLFVTSGIHRGDLHVGKNDALDAAAFRQFLDGAGFAPTAALSTLVW